MRVMRGSNGAEGFHSGKHIVRQNLHAAHAPGQHDLEAHAVQRGQVGKNRVGQLPQHARDSLAVRGERDCFIGKRTVFMRFGVKPPLARADALGSAGGQHDLLRHAEQLVFQRRAADIADQNIHSPLLAFFLYCSRWSGNYQYVGKTRILCGSTIYIRSQQGRFYVADICASPSPEARV